MTPLRIAVVAALVLVGCGKQDAGEKAKPLESGPGQGVKIDAHDTAFRPQNIEAAPDIELVVTIRNSGLLRHTFTVDDPTVDVVIPKGESKTVKLPPNTSVSFYCRFHEANGMRGGICTRGAECPPGRGT
jgi:plastocyanin